MSQQLTTTTPPEADGSGRVSDRSEGVPGY